MTHPLTPKMLERHVAVLGKTGSGKTYAAKGAVEALAAKQQVVILDPTSAWWGLRLKADGKTPAIANIAVLGGRRGDLPLSDEPASAVALAEAVCQQGLSVVLDTSDMTVGGRTRWSAKFAETFYRRITRPTHLIIDEAHEFAPQAGGMASPEATAMLHGFRQLASGGRSRGVRLLLITQRPAKLHKDVLTCCDTLVAMRMIAPQDREAVKAWVEGCGDSATAKEVLNSLANLRVGTGWVWSPDIDPTPRQHSFPRIKTYDSSQTPTGEDLVRPPAIDPAQLKGILDAAGEKIRETDPSHLQREVARLKRALAEQPKPAPTIPIEAIDRLDRLVSSVKADLELIRQKLTTHPAASGPVLHAERHSAPHLTARSPSATGARAETRAPVASGGAPLPKAERSILTVLAQRGKPVPKATIAVQSRYAVNGGGFNNAISALRRQGFIDGYDPIKLTEAGRDALGPVDPPLEGQELLASWIASLPKAEKLVLQTLAAAGPLPKPDLASRCGYAPDGGGFNNALSKLRTLLLIEGKSEIALSQELQA